MKKKLNRQYKKIKKFSKKKLKKKLKRKKN